MPFYYALTRHSLLFVSLRLLLKGIIMSCVEAEMEEGDGNKGELDLTDINDEELDMVDIVAISILSLYSDIDTC